MARLLLILMCIASAVACSKKSADSGDQAATVTSYVVKGDPHLLLKGAVTQSKSPYTDANILDLNDYALMALTSFSEKEKVTSSSEEPNLEEENAANDGSAPVSFRLQVTRQGADTFVADIQGIGAQIVFKRDANNDMQISSITADGENMPMKVLHWSQTADKGFVSVLLDYTDTLSGKTLLAMYFQKNTPQQPRTQLSKSYYYLDGPGVATSWDSSKPLRFEVCADTTAFTNTQAAVSRWQQALTGRLNISVTRATAYAPFTDLNQHCLYMVDTYISDPRNDVANFGLTVTIRDHARGLISDSDVLIFRAEFDKLQTAALQAGYTTSQYQQSLYPAYLSYTLIHEFGHVLGLDHQFDNVPSIMSYKFQVSSLTSYDVAAVQALYPSGALASY